MRKRLLLIGVAGIAGLALLGFHGSNASADLNSDKVLAADLQVALENYSSPKELAAKILEDAVEESNKDAVKTVTAKTSSEESENTDSDSETEKSETEENTAENTAEEEKSAKELISNLNYDRLGVAKVDNWLNIRQKPGIDQKIIGKLPKNAGCNIYSIKNGWAKIKSGNVTGYVASEYLLTDEEAEEYALEVGTRVATVKTQTLNVRFLPATDSAIYTLVPIDEDMDVCRENLSKEFIDNFTEDNFTGSDKSYVKNVDKEAMYEGLDNWVCVKIDSDKVFVSKEYVDISYQLKKAVAIEDLSDKTSSSSSESSGVTSVRANMVQFAMQYLGNRYVWGGTSLTSGTDCSGFTMRIYQNFGYSIPRTSSAQAAASTRIVASQAQPGDLFFYGSGSSVSHVAMYIGNGQVIHASNERDGIKISNAYYRTPLKIGRFINN